MKRSAMPRLLSACLIACFAMLSAPTPASIHGSASTPITSVTYGPVSKYNAGFPTKFIGADTFSTTTGSDGNIYTLFNDSITGNWQAVAPSSNTGISMLSGFTTSLTGTLVNSNAEFGTHGQTGSDGNSYKAGGLISVNGVQYEIVARQSVIADASGRYINSNAQIVSSSDFWATKSPLPPSTAQPYTSPEFTGATMATGVFVQYEGADYQGNTHDNSNLYVYAIYNNGFWNNGDALFLARCLVSAMPNKSASDWSFYIGNSTGDITSNANWSGTASAAVPILSATKQLGITGAQYLPKYNRYLAFGWYYPSVAAGQTLDTSNSIWTAYEAPSPRGPWTAISSKQWNIVGAGSGLYNPDVVPKSLTTDGGHTIMTLSSGDFFSVNAQTGEYTMTLVPVTVNFLLKRDLDPASNDNDPMWLERAA